MSNSKSLKRVGETEKILLRMVSHIGRFLCKFIGGIKMPKKGSADNVEFIGADLQNRAFSLVLQLIQDSGESGVFPIPAHSFSRSIEKNGFDCTGLAGYCDGNSFIDYPRLITQVKSEVLLSLMDHERLHRMILHQSFEEEHMIINSYLMSITHAVLGNPIVVASTNGKLIGVWINKLQSLTQADYTIHGLALVELERIHKELIGIDSTTLTNLHAGELMLFIKMTNTSSNQ